MFSTTDPAMPRRHLLLVLADGTILYQRWRDL